MRRTDGELILLWALPVLALIWLAAFVWFPGFPAPMSPQLSAQQVADFYRDPRTSRIRYSMVLFNWFCVGLIPMLILIAMQIRRMAHRTPIFPRDDRLRVRRAPTLFLVANVCWLLRRFGPTVTRADPVTQRSGLAHVHHPGPHLIAQSVLVALAVYFDDPPPRCCPDGWRISTC